MMQFGSLGKEERKKYAGSIPTLFVFDVLHFNGRVRAHGQRA